MGKNKLPYVTQEGNEKNNNKVIRVKKPRISPAPQQPQEFVLSYNHKKTCKECGNNPAMEDSDLCQWCILSDIDPQID